MDGKLSIQERATIHTVVLPLRKLLRKCIENTSSYVVISFMGRYGFTFVLSLT